MKYLKIFEEFNADDYLDAINSGGRIYWDEKEKLFLGQKLGLDRARHLSAEQSKVVKDENINRIKEMMGIICENDELTNRILDKINQFGMESLSNAEKQYLDNKSQDVVDDELEDIVSIDSGYEFNDTVDDYDVKFIYEETEEWDEDPMEYKHTGEFFIDGEEYYATMYTDENYDVHSFDLHNGDDYEEFDDELEEGLLEFFQKVGDKIKQSMV